MVHRVLKIFENKLFRMFPQSPLLAGVLKKICILMEIIGKHQYSWYRRKNVSIT